jgi:hypothetical protein
MTDRTAMQKINRKLANDLGISEERAWTEYSLPMLKSMLKATQDVVLNGVERDIARDSDENLSRVFCGVDADHKAHKVFDRSGPGRVTEYICGGVSHGIAWGPQPTFADMERQPCSTRRPHPKHRWLQGNLPLLCPGA